MAERRTPGRDNRSPGARRPQRRAAARPVPPTDPTAGPGTSAEPVDGVETPTESLPVTPAEPEQPRTGPTDGEPTVVSDIAAQIAAEHDDRPGRAATSSSPDDTSVTEVIDPAAVRAGRTPKAQRPARQRETRAARSWRRPFDPKQMVLNGPGAERLHALLESRAAGRARRRHRFTGRAVVLVLVLAVLTISYASSLRAYVQQRAHLGELKAEIAEREANIKSLEREKERWNDPAFIRAQARAQLGYLMPGEIGYQVIDATGEPLDPDARLSNPDDVVKTKPTPWWEDAWASVELAGNPPAVVPRNDPNATINGTKKKVSEGKSDQ